ncbi:MAG: hypothetical protein JF603_07785 [Acidobacteria bacterium]|nr:hypothetical protein [Acidobacteriota bacterium]
MRQAMADAEVGDDAYGEDPTVNALQELYASMVGKEAALFVPSGTMANQLAVRVQARRGTSVVAGRRSHVVAYENGAAAANSGAQLHAIDDDGGRLRADDIRWVMEAAGHHQPVPSLICIENTAMAASGACWPLEDLRAVGSLGLPVHLDGARLFNAAVATAVSAADLAAPATTVMSCLSKGLAAPVGSLLAGPTAVIDEARAERARLGGSMRQAGVLAAAGLVALRTMVDRLADDHARARRLADAVAGRWPGAGFDPAAVRTNIVCFPHEHPDRLLGHLAEHDVLAGTIAPNVVRLVTHLDVDDDGIDRVVTALRSAP